MVEGELEVFFGDQTFIEIGLPFGENFGLILFLVSPRLPVCSGRQSVYPGHARQAGMKSLYPVPAQPDMREQQGI